MSTSILFLVLTLDLLLLTLVRLLDLDLLLWLLLDLLLLNLDLALLLLDLLLLLGHTGLPEIPLSVEVYLKKSDSLFVSSSSLPQSMGPPSRQIIDFVLIFEDEGCVRISLGQLSLHCHITNTLLKLS